MMPTEVALRGGVEGPGFFRLLNPAAAQLLERIPTAAGPGPPPSPHC
ncbi:MAG TPA: hypothetical protein VK129_02605 [Terriglobales bacterium]|nr:hypothetical protein [Terriglobales bacterium]